MQMETIEKIINYFKVNGNGVILQSTGNLKL